jgi:hypothetical protein
MLMQATVIQIAIAVFAALMIVGLFRIWRRSLQVKGKDRDELLEQERRERAGDRVSRRLRGPRVLLRATIVGVFLLVLYLLTRSGFGL